MISNAFCSLGQQQCEKQEQRRSMFMGVYDQVWRNGTAPRNLFGIVRLLGQVRVIRSQRRAMCNEMDEFMTIADTKQMQQINWLNPT